MSIIDTNRSAKNDLIARWKVQQSILSAPNDIFAGASDGLLCAYILSDTVASYWTRANSDEYLSPQKNAET